MRLVKLFVGRFYTLPRLLKYSSERREVGGVLSTFSDLSLYSSLDNKAYLVNILNAEEICVMRSYSRGSATFSLDSGGRVSLLHSNQMVVEQILAMEKLGPVSYFFSASDDFILVTACLESWRYSFKSPGGLFLEY